MVVGDIDGGSRVVEVVRAQNDRVLRSYVADPGLIQEHANGERRIAQGGYGDRKIFELIQNGADELRASKLGEIRIVLTQHHLYCANEGAPVTPEGADSILRMSISRKRGGQIGRFGVGVKSVLAISDAPQFFSKDSTGDFGFGFGFGREWSHELIRGVVPGAEETPVLRMAQILDVRAARAADPLLHSLLSWATTVVRLPLKPGSVRRLASDLASFPAEFLLFSPHVGVVVLEDRTMPRHLVRQINQSVVGVDHTLEEERPTGEVIRHRWKVFRRVHSPSREAIEAAGELHNRDTVELAWAVPERSGSRGVFWSYFPTKFATTLRGILNAPWKTSEDRQAIFDGNAFNDELIREAAHLVVLSLPQLSTSDDPGQYIDFLPGRGREAPQFADERLTSTIWETAARSRSLIDQDGGFQLPAEIKQPPDGLSEELVKRWSNYKGRPPDRAHWAVDVLTGEVSDRWVPGEGCLRGSAVLMRYLPGQSPNVIARMSPESLAGANRYRDALVARNVSPGHLVVEAAEQLLRDS